MTKVSCLLKRPRAYFCWYIATLRPCVCSVKMARPPLKIEAVAIYVYFHCCKPNLTTFYSHSVFACVILNFISIIIMHAISEPNATRLEAPYLQAQLYILRPLWELPIRSATPGSKMRMYVTCLFLSFTNYISG